MKKIIALLLVLVMAAGLCACGSTAPAKPENTAAPAAEATAAPEAQSAEAPSAAPASDVEWPTGDITVYIPFEVGSPTDISCRISTDWLQKATGKTVFIENDGTGGGARLAELCHAAEPDGMTLMFISGGAFSNFYQGLWENNIADPEAYTPICGYTQPDPASGTLCLTGPDHSFKTWDEFLTYVKANPGDITVGVTAGKTSEIKTKNLFIGFDIYDSVRWVSASSSDLTTGLLGGNIDIGCMDEDTALPYMLDGSLVGLFNCRIVRDYVYDGDNLAMMDSIPIFTDYMTEDEALNYFVALKAALVGPPGMDPALVSKIAAVFDDMTSDPEYADRIANRGGSSDYRTWTTDEYFESWKISDQQVKAVFDKQ